MTNLLISLSYPIFTCFFIILSKKVGFLDSTSNKKIHKKAVPNTLGLTIYFYLLLITFFNELSFEIEQIIALGLFVVIVGFFDDRANLTDRVNKFTNGIYHRLINDGVEMSGGEKQKLTIARALYEQPKLLILDEITSNLDKDSSKIILQNLKNISKRSEMSIIMISHDQKDYEYCDEILNLAKI